ncbi:MAG: tetratricopeptide repeat protein [Byssovorax sp.]
MIDPEALHDQALALLVQGDTAGGITDLKRYLEEEPEDAEAWFELGAAYATIQHWIQAADALRASIDLDGSEPEPRLAYARVLVQIKKLDDAAFQLVQARKLDPQNPRIPRELGLVFYGKKLYDKAARALEDALALAPEDARAHYALGLCHEARRDMGAAVAAYREAIRRDPGFADAHRTLADALAALGEHEAAIAALGDLLAIERDNEQAAKNREVLARALAEMQAHRMLGKGTAELEASALFSEGGFRKKGSVDDPGAPAGGMTIRYLAPLVEVDARLDASHAIQGLFLRFTDPERAAREEDDTFKVTVVGKDGRHEHTNFATALSLTFLREALGCPMTHASALYARLLSGQGSVEWGGARLAFETMSHADRPGQERHGIRVELKAAG